MSTEIVLTPRGSARTSSISVRSTRSNVSLSKSIKKKVSKPFVGKKVALLKAAVTNIAEDVKRKENELDNILDEVESLEKQKEEIKDDIECVSSENEAAVQDIKERIEEERMIRVKEQEEGDEELELLRKDMEDDITKLKVQANGSHADVWSELNSKLKEFKAELKVENVKIAADRGAPLEVKGKHVAYLHKERRSVRKILKLMFK